MMGEVISNQNNYIQYEIAQLLMVQTLFQNLYFSLNRLVQLLKLFIYKKYESNNKNGFSEHLFLKNFGSKSGRSNEGDGRGHF